ncbi:hypothetical protein WJX72_005564 [[Myrmecia] bisecta]|uniref:AGL6-like MADS box transcription factor n=1 Tax=[Myrmecia] bisecta TaxID=41462 RepID=A0AAW1QQQ6_9CHLO
MEASQAHNLAEPSLNHPAGRLYELSTMQQALTPAHALLLEAELLKAAALQSMSNTLTAKRARLSALDAGLWEAASPAQDARQLQMELQHVLHAQQAELVARGLQQPVDRTRKREPSDNKRTRRSNSLASTLSSVSALSNDVTSDEGSYEGCCHSSEYAFLASGDYSFFEKVPPANICPSDPLQSLRWKAAQGALPDEWIY